MALLNGLFARKAPSDDLRTALRRIEDLEAGFRGLKGEWLDWYEKMLRLAGRARKREEREAGVSSVPGPAEAPPISRAMADVMKRRAPRRGPTNGE